MAKKNNEALDRIRKRKESRSDKSSSGTAEESTPFLRQVRGWIDALFLAFMFAMFIRLFVFELFMIPTGSMTPALIGDDAGMITEADWDGNGQEDIIVSPPHPTRNYIQVHLRNDEGDFDRMIVLDNTPPEIMNRFLNPENKGKGRRDMIMVNKFSYWFSGPQRGDIAVFKVPDRPNQKFDVTKPVYIKRVAAGPDEDLTLQSVDEYIPRPPGHPDRVTPANFSGIEFEVNAQPMLVNGEPVDDPLYDQLHHFAPNNNAFLQRGIPWPGDILEMPADGNYEGYVMLGDNQTGSSDSRVWGRVPTENIRGKAVLRYVPFPRAFGFLEHAQ